MNLGTDKNIRRNKTGIKVNDNIGVTFEKIPGRKVTVIILIIEKKKKK
jgi:hypothetical protein